MPTLNQVERFTQWVSRHRDDAGSPTALLRVFVAAFMYAEDMPEHKFELAEVRDGLRAYLLAYANLSGLDENGAL